MLGDGTVDSTGNTLGLVVALCIKLPATVRVFLGWMNG